MEFRWQNKKIKLKTVHIFPNDLIKLHNGVKNNNYCNVVETSKKHNYNNNNH